MSSVNCMFHTHKKDVLKKLWLIILCIAIVSEIKAQIYQFRGPNRDGIFRESNLLKEWPEGGPELLLGRSIVWIILPVLTSMVTRN